MTGRYARERDHGTWHLFLRLPRGLRARATRAAAEAGQPLAHWVAALLYETLDKSPAIPKVRRVKP